ncbi:glycosyltransferase family 2 protein [Helicobacter sp. MIT 99-5507]|uniref:glycosyltransferase family 2 protein n=1 Tax=Helicobacter sp. MIT 99-5507 TaxID=152489 RepID=UPI000E1F8351|nr:glycosyltransferase family 2 protein [Helicobacter sp. MIT 99-5507]RDU57582.1 glycosyltransferase [Helicobacter sp. MIT 99-5507]
MKNSQELNPTIYLIVPCYNEEEIINLSVESLDSKIQNLINNKIINKQSKIVFVNDGSKDKTLEILKALKKENIIIINLSRNCGHQNALLAGLEYAIDKCDLAISLDCDLQDDINAIDSMVERFKDGYEVVYGVRDDRSSDSFFKRFSAQSFYDLMHFLGVKIVKNHADYRALSNRAIKSLLTFREVNLFLRGIIPLLGYKSCHIFYKRNARVAGSSKYPFLKMLSFALDGITSFSVQPLRILSILGAIISLASLFFGIWALVVYFMGGTISGWTSVVVPMYFLGGVQILGLGILGEYIGKIYKESKSRPRYFIDSIID